MLSMQVTNPAGFFSHRSSQLDASMADPSSASVTGSAPTSTGLAARQLPSDATSTPMPTAAILSLLSSQLAEESAIANSTSSYIANLPETAYVWPFGFFVGLAGVFFVTSLLLPLVGPNILRIAVQRSYKVRKLWIFWPFVFAAYYITVYWIIPEIMQKYLQCGFVDDFPGGYCLRLTSGYYYLEYFEHAGYNPINTASYIISAVVMGMIGLVNLTLAIMFRRGAVNTLTWLLFAAVVIVVYVIDFYLSVEQYYPFPIGTGLSLSAIIPILYLLVVWSVPQLLDLWRLQKLKRKEKIN